MESTTASPSSSAPYSLSQSAVRQILPFAAPAATECTTPPGTLSAWGCPSQSSVGPTPPLTTLAEPPEPAPQLASIARTAPPGAATACGCPAQSSVGPMPPLVVIANVSSSQCIVTPCASNRPASFGKNSFAISRCTSTVSTALQAAG